MILKDKVNKYIHAFCNKDVNAIKQMISDDIYIKDWQAKVEGKKNAILFYQNIFEISRDIKIEIKDIWNDTNVIIIHLQIGINEGNLNVIDVIKFDQNIKISEIIAFKQ